MPTFTIGQRGTIKGIPGVGAKKHFQPGDPYTTEDGGEIAILRGRPDYVASEIPEDDQNDQPVAPIESVMTVPEEPTELEVAHQKQAFKDKLATTPQNKLWLREFPDGSLYKTVWKHGMKKAEFVEKILEKLDAYYPDDHRRWSIMRPGLQAARSKHPQELL